MTISVNLLRWREPSSVLARRIAFSLLHVLIFGNSIFLFRISFWPLSKIFRTLETLINALTALDYIDKILITFRRATD